ncbi:50S ribosomal protein L31 [bacterium]|nr:50S ribosomal protein L31 [bacterium]
MKKGIHPELKLVTVTCACGNSFEALSVRDEVKVEVCSSCHPFFTGKKRVVDTAGRVERFMSRAGRGTQYGQKAKSKKAKAKQPETAG